MNNDLFKGLKALSESSFPKRCANCGKIYLNVEEYVKDTESLRNHNGLKASEEDDGSQVLEVYRNCPCGSTLMNYFQDRRDISEQGQKRRMAFERVMNYLIEQGLTLDEARAELLKLLRHEPSDLLKQKGIQI